MKLKEMTTTALTEMEKSLDKKATAMAIRCTGGIVTMMLVIYALATKGNVMLFRWFLATLVLGVIAWFFTNEAAGKLQKLEQRLHSVQNELGRRSEDSELS